jgi:hypothetical protein
MENNRKSTLLAGILYLASFVSGMLSIAYAIDDPAYLTRAAAESTQTTWAALFQFLVTIAYLGVAIILYPVLKKHAERLALGVLSFSITSAVCNITGIIMVLLILALSKNYVKTPNPDHELYQLIGGLLHTGRDLINHFAMVVTQCISSIILYLILYTNRLIPKWISLWGIVGSAMAIAASIGVLFSLLDVLTPAYMGINVPLVLQQIVFAFWLIIKGFYEITARIAGKH